MKNFAILVSTLAALGLTACGSQPTQQATADTKALFEVNSLYRVVSVEPESYQFGVALLDANPDHIQNYVHIRIDTKISQRVRTANGNYDRQISPSNIFSVLSKGQVVRVNASRDWDNTLVARKIWF